MLYCDDFSGLDPLSNYVIWNGVYQFSSISIVNQELALQNNGSSPGLAAAYIMNNSSISFHDTVLEAKVEFSSSMSVRSLMGVGFWANPNTPNDNFVTWDLQLDEQNAYLIGVVGGVGFRYPTYLGSYLQPNTVYDLALVIEGTVIEGADYVLGLVNGQPVFSTTLASLASLPSTMHPGFDSNAYGYADAPETLYYSDAIAHSIPATSIPEPATWVAMILGFAASGSQVGAKRAGRGLD